MFRTTHLDEMDSKSFPNEWMRTKEYISGLNCPILQKPESISIRNHYYQYFEPKTSNMTHYFIAVYYDNRTINREAVLRTNIVTSTAPSNTLDMIKCQKMRIYVIFWDSTVSHISSSCTCHTMFTAARWEVNGLKYYVSHWECSIPASVDLLSQKSPYISLTGSLCQQPSTYLPVTFPEKISNTLISQNNRDIALVMKSWFGNWTSAFAPYFVSWMECMKAFNVTHVYASHDALFIKDHIMQNAIKYYRKTGFLSLSHVPTNFDEVSVPYSSFSIDQIGMFLSVNDLYFKNIHKYWQFLQIDIDEIIVPKKYNSLQLSLENLIQGDIKYRMTGSIAAPMALFYMDYEPGNSRQPVYLPVFRQTYRQHIERTIRDGIDVPDATKAFINPEYCLLMGIHYCYLAAEEMPKVVYSTENHFLVHHYRNSCKKLPQDCEKDRKTRFHDHYFEGHEGLNIKERVTDVLKSIHYAA